MTGSRSDRDRFLGGLSWNLAGRLLPVLLLLVITPVLVAHLGIERWGLFSIAVSLTGVLGAIDLGVGVALVRFLAISIRERQHREGAEFVVSAVAGIAASSSLVVLFLWPAIPLLVGTLSLGSSVTAEEAIATLRIASLAAPLICINGCLWGTIVAHHRFRLANVAAVFVDGGYFIGMLTAALLGAGLTEIMATMTASRLLGTFVYSVLCLRCLPLRPRWRPMLARYRTLVGLGSWMTLADISTQFANFLDRNLLGAMRGMGAVGFYTTPLELAQRARILPTAINQTLMPTVAGSLDRPAQELAAHFDRGLLALLGLVYPASLIVGAVPSEILTLWVGPQIGQGGGKAMAILSFGILFSCCAYLPAIFIDAAGQSRRTAQLVLIQVLIFVPIVVLLIDRLGVEGAAVGWTLRALADLIVKMLIVRRVANLGVAPMVRAICLPLTLCLPLLAVVLLPGLLERVILAAVTLPTFCLWVVYRLYRLPGHGSEDPNKPDSAP
jgi:O-antigen/teichoic acid export membrane protein